MLRIRFIPSNEITPRLCRRLWDLRLRNIRLRPEVDPEDDYLAFERYFNDGTLAVTFWDAGGELQGFYGWNVKTLHVHDQQFVRVFGKYLFFDPRHRGSVELVLSGVALGLSLMVKHARAHKVAVAVAYPGIYLGSRQIFEPVNTLLSLEITAAERQILEDFIQEHCGADFDPGAGVVKMRTVPITQAKTSKRPVVHAALADYEALNPRWREGYGLPMLLRVNWTAIKTATVHALWRGLGRKRARL